MKNCPCYAMIPTGMAVFFMTVCELYVKIDEPFQGCIAEEWLRRVVEKTLALEEVNSPVELGLVITDDETIRQLNRSYRGRDETTDVLSFALRENRQDAAETPFISPPQRRSSPRRGAPLLSPGSNSSEGAQTPPGAGAGAPGDPWRASSTGPQR